MVLVTRTGLFWFLFETMSLYVALASLELSL